MSELAMKRSESIAEIVRPSLCCSFCGAKQHEVAKLIVGPALVSICSDCVENCASIVRDARVEKDRRGWADPEMYLFWGVRS